MKKGKILLKSGIYLMLVKTQVDTKHMYHNWVYREHCEAPSEVWDET